MKILIYCTKKKPYLFENYTDKVTWDKVFARKFGEWNRFMLIGAKPDYIGSGNYYLNGFVCFECDCKEAIKLMYWCYNIEESDAGFYGDNKDGEMFCNRNFKRLSLGKDDISTNDKLFEYGKGKDLYAYHFENVKPIDPMPITQLYKDEACNIPLTRAPQSYCFAYRLTVLSNDKAAVIGRDDDGIPVDEEGRKYSFDPNLGGFSCIEKVLVFSIRSPWLALEVNIDPKTGKPCKDLEVRKTRILNAGIEYK